MKKKAIIFGVTGQDGAYLSKFLLQKGYVQKNCQNWRHEKTLKDLGFVFVMGRQ